jgi:hypothetical protein
MVAATASATVMRTASTTAAVETAASATAVTTTATLRECGRRAEQHQRSNCCEDNL